MIATLLCLAFPIIFVVGTSDLNSCSNVWCFHLIVLLRNMQDIAKELHAYMFFQSAKTEKDSLSTRVLNKAWSPVRRSRALCPGFDELTITKITRKVNAPNIRRWKLRALCAGCFELAIMLCLHARLRGKLIIRTNEMTRLYKSDNYTKITPN